MSGLQGDKYRADLVHREALDAISRHDKHKLWVECVHGRRSGMEVVIMCKLSPMSQSSSRLVVLESDLAGSTGFCNRIAQELAKKYGLELVVPSDEDDFIE